MIIVYSSPSCGNCNKAKNTLTEKGLDFQEIDITQDNNARNKLLQGGFARLPVFELDGELYNDIKNVL